MCLKYHWICPKYDNHLKVVMIVFLVVIFIDVINIAVVVFVIMMITIIINTCPSIEKHQETLISSNVTCPWTPEP